MVSALPPCHVPCRVTPGYPIRSQEGSSKGGKKKKGEGSVRKPDPRDKMYCEVRFQFKAPEVDLP